MLGAAMLWSVAGLVAKRLDLDSGSIAVYRSGFAGLALLMVVPPSRWVFRPAMAPLGLAFGAMIGLYLGAIKATTAANAIYLQYTAPFWIVPLGMVFLKERPDRRAVWGIGLATLGVLAIVGYGVRPGEGRGVALALASGVAYAVVVVGLRGLRDLDPIWLSAFNNLAGAAALALWIVATGSSIAVPTPGQAATLAAFGVIQMAIPYALFARGLRDVGAAEAGLIGLIEPVLAPIWVALFHGETPTRATLLGGAFLLAGVALRYWPTTGPVDGRIDAETRRFQAIRSDSRARRGCPIRGRTGSSGGVDDEPLKDSLRGDGRRGVEGDLLEVGQRVVVDQRRGLADEEVGVALDVQVEHRLDRPVLDPRHPLDPAEGADRVADLQVARHHPAAAGDPEAVRRAGDDRVAAEGDLEGRARRVVVGHHDRAIGELAGVRVLAQHEVADLDRLDRPRAAEGADGRPLAEATVADEFEGHGLGHLDGYRPRLIFERDVLDHRRDLVGRGQIL